MWTAHVEMGMLLSSDGETDRAAEHFEFVRNQASATGERWMLSYAIYGLGLVALGREQYHEAAQFAIESLRLKRAFEDTVGTTLVIDLLAWAEAASGSGERAAVFLGAASTMWDSFGMQLYGSQHWVERHATYELRARNLLGDNAYQDASRRGATMSPAEITAFALDEETQRRTASPEPEHVLSAREQDIAGYIAEGLSNKEIATLMVLSVRTVEGHVSNLLRKLGVSRRQQVPTALVR
jgi:ATP/maltotriose-dependent transcriptional regulator MalT